MSCPRVTCNSSTGNPTIKNAKGIHRRYGVDQFALDSPPWNKLFLLGRGKGKFIQVIACAMAGIKGDEEGWLGDAAFGHNLLGEDVLSDPSLE